MNTTPATSRIAALIAIALLTGSCAMPESPAEVLAWHDAASANTVTGYSEFLAAHPRSRFAEDAEQRRSSLKREESRREAREAEVNWREIAAAGTSTDLSNFLRRFPNAEQSGEARARLEAMVNREAELRWLAIQDSGTVAQLADFLFRYPTSTRAPEVRVRLQRVAVSEAWQEALALNTASAYRNFLYYYSNTSFGAEARGRLLASEASEAAAAASARREAASSRREEWKRRAEAASPAAAATLGSRAWNEGNYEEALPFLQRAVEQGHSKSNFVLAIMYWNGQGVRQDFELAIKHMLAARGNEVLAEMMQRAYECAKPRSGRPALVIPRGPLQMANDGQCLHLGMNPFSVD